MASLMTVNTLNQNGEWRLTMPMLAQWPNIMQVPIHSGREDSWIWTANKSGMFSFNTVWEVRQSTFRTFLSMQAWFGQNLEALKWLVVC